MSVTKLIQSLDKQAIHGVDEPHSGVERAPTVGGSVHLYGGVVLGCICE